MENIASKLATSPIKIFHRIFRSESRKFIDRATPYIKKREVTADGTGVALSHEESPVVQNFLNDFFTTYLVDTGSFYQYVQNRHLKKAGLGETDVHNIAMKNLFQLSQHKLEVRAHGNIFAALMGGDFEASLILLDELWDGRFRQFVKGDYAVAIPARDILAFCDNTSESGRDELNQLIRKLYPSGDHVLSDRILIRRQGKWL